MNNKDSDKGLYDELLYGAYYGLYLKGIISRETYCEKMGIDVNGSFPDFFEQKNKIIPDLNDTIYKKVSSNYNYKLDITSIGDEVKTYLVNGKIKDENELNVVEKDSPLTNSEYNPALEIDDE
jgi:hypothetical protein